MCDDVAERRVLQRGQGKARQVARGGVVLLVVVAVGVCEVGGGHAQGGRSLVHARHEAVHRARTQYRQRVGGVVAAAQHQPVKQIARGHLLARRHRCEGAVLGHFLGRLGNGDHPIGLQGLQRQQQRHDFGGAGGVHPLVGLLVEDDFA